jgi:hypothetical protein
MTLDKSEGSTPLPNDFSVSKIRRTMNTHEKRAEAPAESSSTLIIIVAVGACDSDRLGSSICYFARHE